MIKQTNEQTNEQSIKRTNEQNMWIT